ncbi:MAG TPA: hypothetical protein VH141_15195 [Pseudonocardia sp.]|jgi:hypothetical protein|nr:hypothetical protein [Pseudonocardia sp.]
MLRLLTDEMDKADTALWDAERDGNTSARIVALRERAALWVKYGELLTSVGAESTGAALAAQRDLTTAHQLADEATR